MTPERYEELRRLVWGEGSVKPLKEIDCQAEADNGRTDLIEGLFALNYDRMGIHGKRQTP